MMEVIGRGGMAVIYKALDTRLNRYVAIKILREDIATDPELLADFTSEAQAIAKLTHPNIVAVYDVVSSPAADYIVMELIEGITLKQYILRRGALSWKEALHFSTQIAKALAHAHSKGIIHRDIKPQNVMILKVFPEVVMLNDMPAEPHFAGVNVNPPSRPEMNPPWAFALKAIAARRIDDINILIIFFPFITMQSYE